MDQKVQQVLQELERMIQEGVPFWNISATTGNFLNMLVHLTKAQKVLEVGTSNGYSGIYLAEALSHNKGLLYTIESHKKRFALAQANFEKSGLSPYIQQIFGHAPEILSDLHHEWDMVFLDATKMEYKSYLETLLTNIRPGGLIVADNAVSHERELKEYSDFVLQHSSLQSVLLPFDKGLLLTLKKF